MKRIFVSMLLMAFVIAAFAVKNDVPAMKTKASEPVAPKTNISTISGKVVDLTTGEALVGVEVTIEGSNIKTHTDLDGNFKIDNLTPGSYNVIASYISYNKSLIENLDLNKSNNDVKIKLQSAN